MQYGNINTTVAEIPTCDNQSMQVTISEQTTHQTLKQMGDGSIKPYRLPLKSAKNSLF